jgi:hypothetical protein
MSVGKQLQEIYDDNGAITPQLVVETARSEKHPLHNHFVWDDSIAGELYRCNQAAQMIRRVTIRRTTPDGDEVVTRAWVSRTEIEGQAGEEPPVGQYLPVEVVISSPDLRPKYEQAMEREWKALYAKYKEYQAFIAMVTADIQAVA